MLLYLESTVAFPNQERQDKTRQFFYSFWLVLLPYPLLLLLEYGMALEAVEGGERVTSLL